MSALLLSVQKVGADNHVTWALHNTFLENRHEVCGMMKPIIKYSEHAP